MLLPFLALLAAVIAPAAGASTTQQAIFEDDTALHSNMTGTLQTFQQLGVTRVRVFVSWASIAPAANSKQTPKHFDAANPGAYSSNGWSFYDKLDRAAKQYGISLDYLLTAPVPRWAEGPGAPGGRATWKPNAADFGSFVRAIGTRYDGHYKPAGGATLPRISFWSIWNEPNYVYDLSPQMTGKNTVGTATYRNLVGHAWTALRSSGHAGDTILFGEVAPHAGNGLIDPLIFIRAMYCVGGNYRPLRGTAAAQAGCPTTAGASRRFRSQNPALFSASGFADHPYAQSYTKYGLIPPNKSLGKDPNYTDLAVVGRLESSLDRLNRAYGSGTKFKIYSTEYGFQTNPPEQAVKLNPTLAAEYMNWAEFISYKDPRIASYSQYLLIDPPGGNFASGLEYSSGQKKPGFAAYQLPLYMPTTSAGQGTSLEVWGGVRPAPFADAAEHKSNQVAALQFEPAGSGTFTPIQYVVISGSSGYFDIHRTFTQSGTLRLLWNDQSGAPSYSRTVSVTVK